MSFGEVGVAGDPLAELLAFVAVGQGDGDGGDVGVLDEADVDLGQLIGDQAEDDVDLLDVGVLGPVEKADEVGFLDGGEGGQVAFGDKVLGVVEDEAEAFGVRCAAIGEHAFDELVEGGQHGGGVAGDDRGVEPGA